MPRGLGRLAGAIAAVATTAPNVALVDSAAVPPRRPPQQPPGAEGASAHAGRSLLLRLAARRSAALGGQWRPTGRGRSAPRRRITNANESHDDVPTEDDENHSVDDENHSSELGWPHRHHQKAYEEAEKRPVFFGMVCGWTLLIGLGVVQCVVLGRQYHQAGRHMRAQNEEPTWSFVGFIRYRFGWWFTWKQSAYTFVVCQILVVFIMLFASLYCYYEGVNATTSMYKVLIWLMCPDGGAFEKSTEGQIIGGVVSLGGLLILAFAISMVHAAFSNYLDLIRTGYAPVVEGEHIVILGYTDETIVLVEELCLRFRHKGGIKIAILAEGEKGSIEAAVRDRMQRSTYSNSNVLVRSGCSVDLQALQHVSLATAALVIVMPNNNVEEEQRDALTLQTLFLLRRQGWPLQGKVLVACSLVRNAELLKQAGGSDTSVVMLNSCVAKLMSHWILCHGLGMAINNLFHANAFFTEIVPEHLVGLSFSEAFAYYSDAVVVGIISPSTRPEEIQRQCSEGSAGSSDFDDLRGMHHAASCDDGFDVLMCPGDRKLQAGAELVFVAPQSLGAHASPSPDPGARPPQAAAVPALRGPDEEGVTADTAGALPQTGDQACQTTGHGRTIILLGWNEWTPLITIELDRVAPPQTQIIIFDRDEVAARNENMRRALRNWKTRLQNVEVKNVEGQLGSYWQLEETLVAPLEEGRKPPLEEATHVFVMARQDTTPEKADAYAVTTILHIRDIMQKRGLHNPDVSFVPQISGSKADPVCKGAGISDYVSTSDLMAKVLAVHAVDLRVGKALDIAVSGTHAEMGIRTLENYLGAQAIPESVSFFDAARLVGSCGDVLLGWTGECPNSTSSTRFVLNPLDKASPRPWSRSDDRLMVLHRQRALAPAGPQLTDDHD